MKSANVHINELRLRASGVTPEKARCLGETVAKRLAELPLATEQSRTIASVTVCVRSSATSSIERMADEVATGIWRELG